VAAPELPRGYLVETRFRRNVHPDRPTLSLTLRPSPESPDGECEVLFEGVSDLHLLDLNTMAYCVLIARDVRDWQHEDVNYAVADSEGEVITFKCLSWAVSS
jgi:hypothetical protein